MRKYDDGSSYIGQWMNNMRHGAGKRTYADGSQYEGQFVKDERHGVGK